MQGAISNHGYYNNVNVQMYVAMPTPNSKLSLRILGFKYNIHFQKYIHTTIKPINFEHCLYCCQ